MATSRDALRGRVQTVLGPIEPDALGPTLMHEHLLCDVTPPSLAASCCEFEEITLQNVWEINYGKRPHAPKYRLDMPEVLARELDRMLRDGGKAIVELTTGGLKPDPNGLATLARDSGAQVIMGCGHYVEEYQAPANATRSVDDFTAEMLSQLFEGAWGTDVRAGIIGEIGCQAPWTELEQRVMLAAIQAQADSGAALNVHPGRDPDQPQQVVDFIAKHGGDLGRTIISHIDRTIFDEARLLRLADSGCVIEFDLFGIEQSFYALSDIDMPNDAIRLKHIRLLIDHGPRRARRHLARHLLPDSPHRVRRPRLRAHLPQCHSADAKARLQRGRDRHDHAAHAAAAAELRVARLSPPAAPAGAPALAGARRGRPA